MQLAPDEEKLIARLRKEESQHHIWRWLMLATGVVSTALAVLFGWMIYNTLYWDPRAPTGQRTPTTEAEVLGMVALWTVFCAQCIFAMTGFTFARRNWRGEPTRHLLLRLLDAEKERG